MDVTPSVAPGPQFLTLWHERGLRAACAAAPPILDRVRPQGVCLHADGFALARHGPALTARLLAHQPGLRIRWAIAGDFDRPDIQGHSDGWEEGARAAAATPGVELLQLNCEILWKRLPVGSATTAVTEVHQALVDAGAGERIALGHTTYGAVDAIDADLDTPGWQNFGGHGTYPLGEFCGPASPVKRTAPQCYLYGMGGTRALELRALERYDRSIKAGQAKGKIGAHVGVEGYFQGHTARVESSVKAAHRWPLAAYWWAFPARSDVRGEVAVACAAELHRQGTALVDLQRSRGLTADELCGPLSARSVLGEARLAAIVGPTLRWA